MSDAGTAVEPGQIPLVHEAINYLGHTCQGNRAAIHGNANLPEIFQAFFARLDASLFFEEQQL